MESRSLLPQNTRLMASLLGFIGGALDIFCHKIYHSLVATQTGNILLLVADWHESDLVNNILRCQSILFFTFGFLFGIYLKDHRKNAYWRSYHLLPLLTVTTILPLMPDVTLLDLPLLAFSTGIMMNTFTGSLIENHPFVIFMTSGNYRKMLTALYRLIEGKGDKKEYKRQFVNYSITVGSFVLGAVSSALLLNATHIKAIWLVSLSLLIIIYYYSSEVKRLGLKDTNL